MFLSRMLLPITLILSSKALAQDPKRLSGHLQVSDKGQVSYGFEVQALPAANGLAPKVTIQYGGNEQATELGQGWFLGAGSSIQRCTAVDIKSEKIAKPVRLQKDDSFCLGSSRLVAIKGENGSDGSEYRTAVDDGIKVIAMGQSGEGPLGFKVFRKNGHVETYGFREEARLANSQDGTVYTWYLSTLEDRLSNRIDYLYSKSPENEILLQEINYGGNIKSGLKSYRAISFEYQSKSGSIKQYQHGIPLAKRSILNRVHVFSETRRIWSYEFNFTPGDDVNDQILNSVRMCADNGVCTAPTIFEYEKTTHGTMTSDVLSQEFVPSKNWLEAVSRRILIDINNDGFTDILGVINLFNKPNIVISRGSASGFQPSEKVEISSITDWKSMDGYPVEAADFNRDGYADVLLGGVSGFYVIHGNEAGFQNPLIKFYPFLGIGSENERSVYAVGEANGDGYPDLIAFKGTGTWLSIGGALGFAEPRLLFDDIGGLPKWKQTVHKRFAFDINSDGFLDVIGFNDAGTIVSLGNPNANYEAPKLWAPIELVDWKARDTQTTFSDVNGDGNIDIIGRRGEGIWVSVNTGRSFLRPELWHSNIHTKECPVNIGQLVGTDLNRDGLGDFILVCGKFVDVIYGKGMASLQAPKFRQIFNWTETWLPKHPFMFDDTNGDGRADLNLFLPQGLISVRNQWQPVQLKRVVDGFGFEQRIEWATLKSPGVYSSSSSRTFPYQVLSGPIRVVKAVETSNGIGGFNKTSYRYGNAFSHYQLGFLGFEFFTEHDEGRRLEVTTKNAVDVESNLFGLPLEKTSYLLAKDRQLLKSQVFTWQVRGKHPGVVQIFNSTTIEKNHEPGGKLLSTIVTAKTYDQYLNILTAESQTTDDSGSSKILLSNTYESFEDGWEVSRLKRAVTEFSKPGFKTVKKVAAFEYDEYGNVKTEMAEPGTSFEKRTDYERNALGIVTLSKTRIKAGEGLKDSVVVTSSVTDSRGYVISTTNSLLQTRSFSYHPDFGTLVTETDPNKLSTVHSYDHWGSRSSSTRPDKTKSSVDLMWCNFTCPKKAVLVVTTKEDGLAPVHTYIDMLGRQLRETRTSMDGRQVHLDVEFGSNGLQVKSSRPYFDGDDPQYTYYFYDDLLRLSSIKNADETTESYEYEGFSKTVTDANTHKSVVISNALGQKLKTINDKGEELVFAYDAAGRLVKIEGPKGVKIFMEYDVYGRQTLLNDPSVGIVTKKYNSLDLPYEVKENSGSVTRYEYDALGRTTKRVDQADTTNERQYEWTYDQSKNGVGKISAIAGPRYETKFFYDVLARNSSIDVRIDNKPYSYEYGYDALSRPVSTLYPTGLKQELAYNEQGFIARVFSGEKTYKAPLELYADGTIKKERLGNGIISTYLQDERNGRLLSIIGESKGEIVHSLHVDHDAAGNVVTRKDLVTGHTESFVYDNLNRLKQAQSSISGMTTFDYDELGNLRRVADKQGVTQYKYGTDCSGGIQNPLSVCKLVRTDNDGTLIKETSYVYDKRGAAVQAGEKTISYDGAGLPIVLKKGSEQVNFSYSPTGERFEREDFGPKAKSRTLYLPHGLEVIEAANDKTFFRHNLSGMVVKLESGRFEESYLHEDHQGSILAISNGNGEVIQRFVHEPWGRKLNASGSLFEQDVGSDVTLRGYTGHEMIDNLGLIHMNGRIYDSDLRRFISPDPYIQDPFNIQSINRYAYCWNNPMTNTDPSGYFSLRSIGKFFRDLEKSVAAPFTRLGNWIHRNKNQAVSMAFTAVAMAFCPPAGFAAYAYAGVVGFTSGYIASNGDLNAASQSAIVGMAFMGVGDVFAMKSVQDSLGGLYNPAKIVAHGTVGGLSSVASGGNFVSGFAAAGVSQAASVYGVYGAIGADDQPQSVGGYLWNSVAAGMVGGTASVAAGGNFEQGAITASMGRLFNDAVHAGAASPIGVEIVAAVRGAVTAALEWIGAGLRAGVVGAVAWAVLHSDEIGPEEGGVPKPSTDSSTETGKDVGVIYVDPNGNAIPTPEGGRIEGSPDGRFVQAKGPDGKPTGVRIDGGHKPASHPDPRAQKPHAHVPGVTNPDGTPWLPLK